MKGGDIMNISKYLVKLKNEERGAVVIIFALMITVIIGFAAVSYTHLMQLKIKCLQ